MTALNDRVTNTSLLTQMDALKRQITDFEKALMHFEKEQTGEKIKSKVKLDVGGTHYSTSRTTLTSVHGSMLEAMFSGRYTLEEDEDGCTFIDRDGETFKHVLEFTADFLTGRPLNTRSRCVRGRVRILRAAVSSTSLSST